MTPLEAILEYIRETELGTVLARWQCDVCWQMVDVVIGPNRTPVVRAHAKHGSRCDRSGDGLTITTSNG